MWLTLKVGGIIIMTMGYADLTLAQCNGLKEAVTANIVSRIHFIIRRSDWSAAEHLEWNNWTVICEPNNGMADYEEQH